METEGKPAADSVSVQMRPPAADGAVRRRARRVVRHSSREGPAPIGPIPQQRSWKNSRRPRNGHGRGLPKKGGAGGKGVWGAPGSELLEEWEDRNDPNYDSEHMGSDVELKRVIPEMDREEVQRKAEPVILEYFETGDTEEALESFLEFIPLRQRYLICEITVELGLDHKPSHREMCSVLLSDLYGHFFSERDIALAFENLLGNLEDLTLDQPAAAELLGCFMARCVGDDCLPPRFLSQRLEDTATAPLARQALGKANTLLQMKHGLVRLDSIWGVGGSLRPVKWLVRQLTLLLKEYLSSGDVREAERCLRELEAPHFHHEMVYEAAVMALEAVSSAAEERLAQLLAALSSSCMLSPGDLERGFLRVLQDMPDIVLDVPLAYITLSRFMERCHAAGVISDRILAKMPTRGRKRFVSEGDGGALKDHSLVLRD